MSQRAFRTLITSVLILVGMGVVVAFYITSNPATQPGGAAAYKKQTIDQKSAEDSSDAPQAVEPDTGDADAEVIEPSIEPVIAIPDEQAANIDVDQSPDSGQIVAPSGLRFEQYDYSGFTPLGSLDAENNPTGLLVEVSPDGAGVDQITLANYFNARDRTRGDEYTLFRGAQKRRPNLALRRVIVNGQNVPAFSEAHDAVQSAFIELEPGKFRAQVVDESGRVVLTISRNFTLGPAVGQITIEQSITNHSDEPLTLVLEQWGPGDLPYLRGGYGDFRRIRFGYTDPRSPGTVLASDSHFIKNRTKWIGRAVERAKAGQSQSIWPNETSKENGYSLAWIASTSRYFALVVHPDLGSDAAGVTLNEIGDVQLFLESRGQNERSIADIPKAEYATRYINLKLITRPVTIAPGNTADLDLGVYAGPMTRPMFTKVEPYRRLNLKELVVYQLGCAFCTFQPITHALLWFLRFIDGQIITIGGIGIGVHDWAIAIIILVLCVRTVLHPLTKRGQVAMQRMAKKTAKIQPEIAKLKEKYKGNPKKLQQEQMALYKEHDINPVGGCLGAAPMMLQSPIWIALYAMLYFAIELRQAPAFYGVFQMFGNWAFLADLSQPDRFISIGHSILGSIPGVGSSLEKIPFIGHVSSINILPILMGFIFFLQQKYLSPPTTTLSKEQESQQKIMKTIMPLVFPLFLYNAPSGLTLYILTSSTIGILESRYIRAHVESLDLTTPSKKQKKPGVWQKAMAEAQRRQQDKAKSGNGSSKRSKGKGRKRGR